MKTILFALSLFVPSPDVLLSIVHNQAASLAVSERVDLLYELAIAATGANRKTSAAWSIEMYDVATNGMSGEQMNRAAQRKNALTVLSFSDPEGAAKRFFELEPSPGHLPDEDPRVDLSRHLFPRLWRKLGLRSLPLIRRMASFTASSGEYPYVALALLLPLIAQVNLSTARALVTEAVHHMPSEHPIHRTQDAYVRFLRAAWPIASHEQRLQAVHAGVLGAEQSVREHIYFEYYLAQGTVKLDSEADARIYELLPFADQADPQWGQSLRLRYPHLQGPVPLTTLAPWRSAAFAAPGRNSPDLIERALERHNVLFAATWAQQDAVRAAQIALAAKDLDLQRTELALVLPRYEKVNAVQAEAWRLELESKAQPAGNAPIHFLVALIRADFRLGHAGEAQRLAWSAWKQKDLEAAQDLEDVCGQFWYGDPSWYAEVDRIEDKSARLLLLARYARGALRNSARYEEPI